MIKKGGAIMTKLSGQYAEMLATYRKARKNNGNKPKDEPTKADK